MLKVTNKPKILWLKEGTKLHTIRKGETLWSIAQRYTGSGANYRQIAKLNNIKNPNLIYAGQTIEIPIKTSNSSKSSSSPSKTSKDVKPAKPSKYILRPEEEKPRRFEFKEPPKYTSTFSLNTKKTSTQEKTSNNRNSGKQVQSKKSTQTKPTQTKATQTGSAKIKKSDVSTGWGSFVRGLSDLYHKIPEDYRTPISLLGSGNFEGLKSYINTAYERKVSNDYVGKQMNKLNVKKGEETKNYRLSEPSTFDFRQANLQHRVGLLGTPISYMNVPYDLNLKDYKWHYRKRDDMKPVGHTMGILAPILGTMTDKSAVAPGAYSGIIFNPQTGQLSVEPDINRVPNGWLVNNAWGNPFMIKGMRKDAQGNLVMVTPDNEEYRNNFTTQYELTNGTYRQPNIFTDVNNRDPKTLGAKAGGHFIISATPKRGNRQSRIVHGSLQQLSDAIDRLKANTGADYVTVYQLDGGSFSMGYIPPKAVDKDKGMQWITINSGEFNKYQSQNPRGSHGFMPIERLPEVPDTTYITVK